MKVWMYGEINWILKVKTLNSINPKVLIEGIQGFSSCLSIKSWLKRITLSQNGVNWRGLSRLKKLPLEHSVCVGLKSAATNLEVNLSASIDGNRNRHLMIIFDSISRFWSHSVLNSCWRAFGPRKFRRVINYFSQRGQMYSHPVIISRQDDSGPNGILANRTDDFIKSWMRILDKFHSDYSKNNIFVPLYMEFRFQRCWWQICLARWKIQVDSRCSMLQCSMWAPVRNNWGTEWMDGVSGLNGMDGRTMDHLKNGGWF